MELSEPAACTLTQTDLRTQRERWLALGERFGLARVETADGLRLRFRYGPAVQRELRALVAIESECCSWAAWSVERENNVLVVAARSTGDGVPTLHSMFTQLGSAGSGGRET